jgi:hypothetical protein
MMKVRILGNVKHDGVILQEYNVYELSDDAAQALLDSGNATTKGITNETPAEKYEARKVKLDAEGRRVPGESVPANEPVDDAAKKGVEPTSGDSVQGNDAPATPAQPETPATPEVPATPEKPAEPEAPVEPEAPAEPEVPADNADEEKAEPANDASDEAETPETPSTPSEPEAPTE